MKVVVVGGGFAGLAAAIALQERRHDVVLLERSGVLGGRASSSRDAVSGEDVDNGTHLLVAAYRDTLDLVTRAGAADLLHVQDNLHIDYVDDRGYSSLRCPPLAAPLHLLVGLLGLRVPARVKWQAARLGLAVRFGAPPQGITLADEVLTPDSSRFWPADKYAPGRAQDSYDKQYVRDYLEQIHWNKQPPAPALPQDVARRTSEKYLEAYLQLTGHKLDV